jgi:hypothetical protein
MCDAYDIKLLSPGSNDEQITVETERCFITSDSIKVDYDEMSLNDILITSKNPGGICGNITNITKTTTETKHKCVLSYVFVCEGIPIVITTTIPPFDKNRSVFIHDSLQCGDKYNKFDVINSNSSTSINFYQDGSIRASVLFNLMFTAVVDFNLNIALDFNGTDINIFMTRC